MTWTRIIDGIPCDADEVNKNFYHIRQGNVTPYGPDFVQTSGVYDLGASSAKWNKIYVNDITGAGTFSGDVNFTNAVTFQTAPSFANITGYPQYMFARYRVASGGSSTNLANLVGSGYTSTALNTSTCTIPGATLTSSQIILPPGTYYASWMIAINQVFTGFGYSLLYEADASVLLDKGSLLVGDVSNPISPMSRSILSRFVLANTGTVELRVAATVPSVTAAVGIPVTFGDSETFTDIRIFKVA